MDLPDLRLRLHPSVALLKSRFPVVSIWRANRHDNNNTIGEWKPECALIARPHGQVEVRPLSAGVYAFIAALAEGRTVGSAIAQGMANVPDFDLSDCFNVLIGTDIVIGLELPYVPPDAHI